MFSAIQELIRQNVRCIILTSGTLYPFEPLEAELNLSCKTDESLKYNSINPSSNHSQLYSSRKFPITLRNPHVINADQLNLSVIPRGPDGVKLNGTYSVRETPAYRNSLGLLLDCCVYYPLLFTYTQMCVLFNSDTYEKLSRFKQIFIEPREKNQFNKLTRLLSSYCCYHTSSLRVEIFNEYRSIACSESSVGAILFSVMRGRVSEGLDLADNTGRGVAILGLPYAPIHDPRVLLKMAYLDEQCVKLKSNSIKDQSQKTLTDKYPTGRQWYNLQAWRAVNQAIGRVIRHYKDYGTIYLCDERFASNDAQLNLASWMHKKCKVYDNVELVVKDTCEFFRAMRNKYPSTGRLIVTSPGVNSTSTGKCSLQSTKPTISSFNNSNMLSNLPSAFEPNIFSPKLNDSTTLVTTSYHSYQLPCSSKPYEYNTECQKGLISSSSLSIFDAVYSELENTNERLLQRRSCKKIKLSEEKSNSLKPPEKISSITTMNFGSTLSSKYIALLKSVLESNEMNESVYANYLNDFKQAMQDYRHAVVFNHKSITNQSNQPVETLFSQLSRIFKPLEKPGLLQDAVCFVLPAHRKRYAELCHNLTRLPIVQPNTVDGKCANSPNQVSNSFVLNQNQPMIEQEKTFEISMKCCKCSADPIIVPLISCCKHVACFKCWRRIIEEGDHLCPVCRKLLRRRDLSRLTQKNAE
ncbi:Regulator of telomere elongation helicase 1 [Schistosoma japonicum]|nr:Regulator of telomere elongation helicase 1 [Schistosoma japonicum]